MDKNSIDIKIREFAFYLKDFGLLNETNIKEFFKTFININENNQASSNHFNNDISIGLIYLKENLSKAMLEFFNLLTDERKRAIYLNIYSKFLQKREKDLFNKGNLLYKIYRNLSIKKYFFKWKGPDLNFHNNRKNKNRKINSFIDLQMDNFCFDIISENNTTNMNNNLIINSNNHRIVFKNNSNPKSENISSMNSYTDINSLILSTKSTVFNSNNNIILNSNNLKNKLFKDNKQSKINKYQTLNNSDKKNVIYENFEQQMGEEKKEPKKQNIKVNKSQLVKSSNKSFNMKNKNLNLNNDNKNKKAKKQFIKLIEKEKNNLKEVNIQTMRKTYNSNRPISNFNYDEYNKKNVYRRLYEQNIEYNKRKEQRIEDNIKEIKERSNHPIIKSNFNKFKNLQNKGNSKNKYFNRNTLNLLENQDNPKILRNNLKTMENLNLIREKQKRFSSFDNKDNNIDDKDHKEKEKKGQTFMENQRKCIELYNEMIKNEEIKTGKKFEENVKEKLFKELLNKIYQENRYNSNENTNDIIDENNINEVKPTEYEKIAQFNISN